MIASHKSAKFDLAALEADGLSHEKSPKYRGYVGAGRIAAIARHVSTEAVNLY